jgi:tetratricopeptide (TPR) repeat protein
MKQSPKTTGQKFEAKATRLRNQGKGYEAVEAYEQARAAYREAEENVKAAGCTHMIGVSYKIENDIGKALPVYEQAAREYEDAGDKLGPGRVWRDAGIMFEYHDRFGEAEEYLQKSKSALETVPADATSEAASDGQPSKNAELGITLAKLGLLGLRRQQFEQAERYLMDGLVLIRKSGHAFYKMTALMHLGSLYFATEHHGRMLANLEAALGLIYEHGMQDEHSRRLSQIWGLMAHGYLAHQNVDTARRYAKKAFALIESLSKTAQGPLHKDIQAEKLKEHLREQADG